MIERSRARPAEPGLRVISPPPDETRIPGDGGPAAPGLEPAASSADRQPSRSRRFLRALRRRSVLWTFLLIACLPTAAAAVYYYGFASDIYVTEARFGIRTPDPRGSDAMPVFQGVAAASQLGLDSFVVVQYIHSRDFLDRLKERESFPELFGRPEIDRLARLRHGASAERQLEYWRGMVDPFFDMTNGTIVVQLRAFSPAEAQRLALEVQALSEARIAELTARLRAETLSMAEHEVARAETRLKDVLRARGALRAREGMIDPGHVADSANRAADRLREYFGRDKAELGALLRRGLSESAPAVTNLRSRIASLEQEIAAIELKASTSRPHEMTLPEATTTYEGLASEQNVAEKALASAVESLERARASAGRQGSYLVTFVRPALPEEPLYPRRARNVLVVFVVGLAVWAIGWLAVATVREHL